MDQGLAIAVRDPDEDYLGILVEASNGAFSGSAYIYAGLEELSELAAAIHGFPRSHDDRRTYEFGSRDPGVAGGFVRFELRCLDRLGHVAVDLVLQDGAGPFLRAEAAFGFQTEPAAVDNFVEGLRKLERDRFGSASLPLV